jgi:hypothetical protein
LKVYLTRFVILSASDKVQCRDSGGVYRRCAKDLNVSAETILQSAVA